MQTIHTAATIHTAETVRPTGLTDAHAAELAAQVGCSEAQVREAHAFAQLAAIDRVASEYVETLEVPSEAVVALDALVHHEGPYCSECGGAGLIDTGHDFAGRAVMERCGCAIESCGEVYCRGAVCPGYDARGCSVGVYPERLGDGGYELPSGRVVCAGCAAYACGYSGGEDSAADLGILSAIEALEGGA